VETLKLFYALAGRIAGMKRYRSVFALLAWALFLALVPPLLMAAFFIADRLQIPVPGDIVTFGAAVFLSYFALMASPILFFFAAVYTAVIYTWGRIEARRQQAKRP